MMDSSPVKYDPQKKRRYRSGLARHPKRDTLTLLTVAPQKSGGNCHYGGTYQQPNGYGARALGDDCLFGLHGVSGDLRFYLDS